jgi:hypothetical protein
VFWSKRRNDIPEIGNPKLGIDQAQLRHDLLSVVRTAGHRQASRC